MSLVGSDSHSSGRSGLRLGVDRDYLHYRDEKERAGMIGVGGSDLGQGGAAEEFGLGQGFGVEMMRGAGSVAGDRGSLDFEVGSVPSVVP